MVKIAFLLLTHISEYDKRFNVDDHLLKQKALIGNGRQLKSTLQLQCFKWQPSPCESKEQAITRERKRFSEI